LRAKDRQGVPTRGREDGFSEQDWFEAEQQILAGRKLRGGLFLDPVLGDGRGLRLFMNCSECTYRYRAFESAYIKYDEARSASFYRVSTGIAAKEQVDMERAKTDLQEHQSVCAPCRDPAIVAALSAASGFPWRLGLVRKR
jgi:hypothetical protein